MAAGNPSFADFVNQAREKREQEKLAQEILGSRGRKANTPGAGSLPNTRNNSQKPTLLSRMSGVQKQRSSSAKPTTTGSIDGKWQHDLHKLNNPNGPPKKLNRTASTPQIERNDRAYNKFRSAIQDSVRNNGAADTPGFSIRGVATGGPYTIIASNFASGTTAADIEAVMAPVGGELQNCRLVASNPTVMAELTFTTKDGAENVIATFNNKKADGRLLYVYMKGGTNTPSVPGTTTANPRPLPRAAQSSYDDMDIDTSGARSGSFQDGRFGFSENGRRDPPRGPRKRY